MSPRVSGFKIRCDIKEVDITEYRVYIFKVKDSTSTQPPKSMTKSREVPIFNPIFIDASL